MNNDIDMVKAIAFRKRINMQAILSNSLCWLVGICIQLFCSLKIYRMLKERPIISNARNPHKGEATHG